MNAVDHEPIVDSCATTRSDPRLKMKTHDQIQDEAHARIIWGEEVAAVYLWLREQGVPEKLATEMVRASSEERATEIRKTGRKNLSVGALMAALAVGLILLDRHLLEGTTRATAPLAVLFVFGLYQAIRGALRVFFGSEHGSITEIN